MRQRRFINAFFKRKTVATGRGWFEVVGLAAHDQHVQASNETFPYPIPDPVNMELRVP